jgi:hypothetical protein
MPDEKEPIPQFAARIKAKYPQYRDVDDTLLAKKIVEKYPEYGGMVDFGPTPTPATDVKKKSLDAYGAGLQKMGSFLGLLPSSTDGKTVLRGDVKSILGTANVESKEQKTDEDDDPIKAEMEPIRASLGEKYTNYLKASRPSGKESTGQRQVSRILKDKNDREQLRNVQMDANAVVTMEATKKGIERQVFPDAGRAAELLSNYAANKGIEIGDLLDPSDATIDQLPKTNETVKAGVEQISDYRKVLSALQESGGSLEDAAINMMRKESPVYNEKIEKIMEGNKYDPSYKINIPEAERGRIVLDWLQNPNVALAMSKDPDLKEQYDNIKTNFYSLYPETGKTIVASKLSQERENRGKNNPILNIVGKATMDKIAEDILTSEEKPIYYEKIRPELRENVDTPGFIENLGSSTMEMIEGIGQTRKELSPQYSNSELLAESTDKAAKAVQVQPKGALNKFGNLTGKFAGIVMPIGYGGRLLQGLNVARSPATANAMMTGLSFYGQEKAHARELMPSNETAQNLYALGATSAFMLGSNIFKDYKALDGLTKEIRPSVANIVKEFEAGKISLEAAKDQATSAFRSAASKALEFGKETAKQNTKSAVEMTAIQFGKNMAEKVLVPESYNDGEHDKLLADTFVQTWLGTTPMGMSAAYSNIKQKPVVKDGLFAIASNPEPYREAVNLQSIVDPSFRNIQDKLGNIDFLVKTKEELDRIPGLKENQKKSYLLQALNEKMITDTMPNEPTLQKKAKELIKQSEINKEEILAGKDVDELPHEQKEPMPDDKLEKELLKVAPEGYKEHHKVLKSEGKEAGWLDYMKDKAAENPDKFIQEFGDDLFDLMIEKVGTKKLENSLNYLNERLPDDSNIPLLEQILEQRYDKKDKEVIEGTRKPKISIIMPGEIKSPETTTIKPKESPQVTLSKVEMSAIGKGEFAYQVLNKGERVGGISLRDKGDYYEVHAAKIDTPNKGIGTEAYREMIRQSDKPIKSDPIKTVPQAESVWKKLVNEGLAEYDPKTKRYTSIKNETIKEPVESPEPAKTGNTPAEPPTPIETTEGKGEEIRLSHADTKKIYQEYGLPERLETPNKSDVELMGKADKLVKDGYDFDVESEKIMSGEKKSFTDEEQVALSKAVAALKAKQEGLDIKSPEFDALQEKIEKYSRASDVSGTQLGRDFRARQSFVPKEETLADYVMREKEAAKVEILTDAQKETVQKEHSEISSAEKAYEEKLQALRDENAKMRAELEVKKAGKVKGEKKDYKKERQEIFTSIQEKLKKARGEQNVTIVPYAKELFMIAPDVAKLVKSYAEQGVVELAEMVKKVHADLKDVVPDIKESDVRDLIAGNYNEKKPTRNKLAETMRDLKDEAKLINKLEALERGEVPKDEKKKVERNRQIKELQDKIKGHDLTKLGEAKGRIKSQIEKIEAQIKSGDFSIPEKNTVKLDKEGQELQDKLIKLKNERQLRILKEEYAASSRWNKIQTEAVNVMGVPRTLMSSTDYSAPLRQSLLPTLAHPQMASKAAAEMFKSSFSKKNYERWFFELENSDRYKLMKDSGLGLSEINNPKLSAKEEQYMNNLAEKIPVIGKLVKGSERGYVMYLNKMRADLFNRFADQMQNSGKTFENRPDQYKEMAKYVNNMTGKGDLGKTLNEAAPLLNQLFFSPKLMFSRLNTLTYMFQPRFWKKLPKEVRQDYFRSVATTVGLGLTVLALAKMAGADTEDDPRSPDFGKIKSGNTRWDIWGGHQQYIRLATQMITGQKKSSTSGNITEIGTDNPYSGTRGGLGLDFLRGKLAPVPSMGVDILSGENTIGEKLSTDWKSEPGKVGVGEYMASHLLPLTSTGLYEAIQDQGQKAWFTVGIPSVFGIGTQSYNPKPPSKNKPSKPSKPAKK